MSLRASTKRVTEKDSTRLRMDSYNSASAGRVSSSSSRPSRAVSPPKRRELDKVMKKARSRDGATQSNYWNKKLLEVEEKDPNRWRHSGYKELYGGGTGGGAGGGSPSGSRASKQSGGRSRPDRGRQRSRERRPHTPQPTTSRATAAAKGGRSPKVVSLSQSSRSLSSCSDESCSVCSPKPKGAPARKKPAAGAAGAAVTSSSARQLQHSPRSRSRSFSVPRSKPVAPPPSASAASSSRLAARRAARRRSSPPRDPRGPPPSPPPRAKPPRPAREPERINPVAKKRKSEGGSGSKSGRSKQRRPPSAPVVVIPESSSSRRHSSPVVSCSDDSSCSSVESSSAPPKLTLSERFGKMAQWSVDRRDLDGVKNMRITKDTDGSDLKVVIEDARYRAGSPMPANDRRTGAGFYPESLHSAPTGLDAWDDVRVRYKYYKDRGYLRDLTLDDYMKWEEWWYKYQEWLENERYYERWDAMRAEQGGLYYDRLKRGGRRAGREFH